MNGFSSLHPCVSALYFVSVLGITMFTTHPLLLAAGLLGGILFSLKTQGLGRFGRDCGFHLVLFLLISLTNPLFSHNGATPLFFLNGNAITLEAVLYGVDLAAMLLAVVYWFKGFQRVMTQDKLLYLFGKISPKISLLLCAALRFIPLLQAQAARIRASQKAMGLYASDAWLDKLRGTVRVYSALITWALEKAMDTGSSMKARGYGLKGRRHYSLYTFRRGDACLLAVIGVLDAVIGVVMATGSLEFSFYPSISTTPVSWYGLAAVLAFWLLSLLPFILETKEGLQWKYYRSRI